MTQLRRLHRWMLLVAALGPLAGCGLLAPGANHAPMSDGDVAALAPPSVDVPTAEAPGGIASHAAQRPTIRAQNDDYDNGGGNFYGGRAVGAVAPGESSGVRQAQFTQPVNPYPNTPGAAAWGNPNGAAAGRPANTYPNYSAPPAYGPNPTPPYTGQRSASPPANYASPSFSNTPTATSTTAGATGGAYGSGYGEGVPPPPPNSFVPGRAVSASGGTFPGGIRPGPGLNPGPGSSVMGDPLNNIEPPKLVGVDVFVNETRTGRMMIGAGINSDAGLIGQFVIDEQNFDWKKFPRSWDDIRNGYAWRGDGQRFRFEAMPGTSVQRYLVSWQEPYLFDTPFTLGLSGFYYDRRFYDWDEGRLGGRVALGYQLPRDWTVTAAFRGENVDVTNPRIFPPVPEVAEMLGKNTLLGAKLSIGHDTRDDAFLPTQGHIVELAHEQVFGTFQYPITTFEARQFYTLTERIDGSGRHVLHVGGQAGWAGGDTPAYDHFYAGGYSTIRGFAFRGASPKSGDAIVGGEFQLLGTVEYMFPITADDMLRGVAFVDAGTVEERHKIEWDDFRVAPGIGLRISNAALGPAPIALDLAFPIAREDGDKIRNFSFFIGLRY
ncbi:MAG: BamA/TamA family outer membrane protein [Pirellulales bacterium]